MNFVKERKCFCGSCSYCKYRAKYENNLQSFIEKRKRHTDKERAARGLVQSAMQRHINGELSLSAYRLELHRVEEKVANL